MTSFSVEGWLIEEEANVGGLVVGDKFWLNMKAIVTFVFVGWFKKCMLRRAASSNHLVVASFAT